MQETQVTCVPSLGRKDSLEYLGFSYLGRGVSFHGCSSKAQPLLLTLEEGYLLTLEEGYLLTLEEGYLLMDAPPDLERGVAPGPAAPTQLGKNLEESDA